jgi:hypothetical protein
MVQSTHGGMIMDRVFKAAVAALILAVALAGSVVAVHAPL